MTRPTAPDLRRAAHAEGMETVSDLPLLTSDEIRDRLSAGLRKAAQFERDLGALSLRGVSRRLIVNLVNGNATEMARDMVRLTYTPPPRKGLSRQWWRLRRAFGATDPHDVRRAEVAQMIAELNGREARS